MNIEKHINEVISDTELITLFKEFSSQIATLKLNKHYISDARKYKITYLEVINSDYGARINPTPVRIHNTTGEIQVNGAIIEKLGFGTSEMMFVLLSTYCQKYTDYNVIESDMIALKIMQKLDIKINPNKIINMFQNPNGAAEHKHILDRKENIYKELQ